MSTNSNIYAGMVPSKGSYGSLSSFNSGTSYLLTRQLIPSRWKSCNSGMPAVDPILVIVAAVVTLWDLLGAEGGGWGGG